MPECPRMQHIDIYADEGARFEGDVNLLIRNTLHAALAHLSSRADAELADIKEALDKATDDEVQEHLVDSHVDVLATALSQERFLRNMAVVALASRLLHSLKRMARMAESFCPSAHNFKGKSEFLRIWAEYTARFSIDFTAHADQIAFVEPMVRVRNQIVHEGAEANTWNDATLESLIQGRGPALDTTFSKGYPDFVTGEGWDAEVVVSQEQLDTMCNASVALVRWLATELDAQDQAARRSD
jgi:hypothetical protein